MTAALRLRWIIIAVLAGLVSFGLGFYLIVVRPLFVVAETVPLAERALATSDMVLLAGINVKQAVFLERWFIGTPPAAAQQSVRARSAADRTLLDHLRAVHADPREDVDYLLYAIYPSDASSLRHAVVLAGRFDPGAINAYLAGDLRATQVLGAGTLTYDVTLTDPTSCQPASSWRVTATSGWILLADPASHAAILPRLASAAETNEGDLAWWRELARPDVLSLGIRNPERLASVTSVPAFESAAREISAQVDPFQRVYLGLGIKAVPPEGALRVVIDAKDAGRAADQIKTWRRAIDESRERWAATMPSVAALYDSLTVSSKGARNTIEITVNRAAMENLRRIVRELLTSLLAGFGVHQSAPATSPAAERIDPTPQRFEPTASAARLGPYDPNAQFAEKVERITGPFGLRLDSLRLGSSSDTSLEITVEGFANAIPNIATDSSRARLFVDSVKSSSGQELLKQEECGRERNSQAADFKSAMPPRLKATKPVRLIASADPRALQSVAGHVELRLPTRTDTITIAHPAAGAVIERYGAALSITEVSGGSVSYQIAGASDRVLLLRALNAAGKPLDRHMAASGDFLFGEGIAGQSEYAGKIDALEIVLAADEQTTEYPFMLTDFSFAGEPHPQTRDDTPEFRAYTYQMLRQDYSMQAQGRPGAWKPLPPPAKPQSHIGVVQLEPFELSFDGAKPFYALKLDFTLRSPEVQTFKRRFNFGELRLANIALKDGSTLAPPPETGPPPSGLALGSSWHAPIRFMSTAKDRVLATSLYFLIDTKAAPEQLKSVEGALTIQLPTALRTLRLDDMTVGQNVQAEDLTVTVTARGRSTLVLQASKDGERVVYVRLLDKTGQALAYFGPEIAGTPGGGAHFDFSPLSPPARAEIVVASEVETRTLPFAFSLP